MQHPFDVLKQEYSTLLAHMLVTRQGDVDLIAHRLVLHYHAGRYTDASQATGVWIPFMAASFEREASSDFTKSAAQGDRWDRVSVNVPRGRGPFASWTAAAVDAYHLDGLDKVGAGHWTWPLACFYGELFNGFGYRDYHQMHSPYLWGGTNIQQPGKYTSDGKFDPNTLDRQIGIVPMMQRMVELVPDLALPGPSPFAMAPGTIGPPALAPVGVGGGETDTDWIQESLNALGADPQLDVDGNYGRQTRAAVRAFQTTAGITVDGFVGPQTIAAIKQRISTESNR
jgi:lysozyme family protein